MTICCAHCGNPFRPTPITLSCEETAIVLGVSASTVWRMVQDGDLPRVTFGTARVLRIPTEAVENLVARAIAEAAGQQDRLVAVRGGSGESSGSSPAPAAHAHDPP